MISTLLLIFVGWLVFISTSPIADKNATIATFSLSFPEKVRRS